MAREWVTGDMQYGQSDAFGMAGLGRLSDGAAATGQATTGGAWDFLTNLAKDATQAYGYHVNPASAGTQPPKPIVSQQTQQTSNWLLYGGIGLLAVAGIWYMMKKKK